MGCIHKFFTPVRDTLESAASLAGNYYLPGSSLLTDHLVSKGSQKQLGSPLGQIAQIGTGLAGGGAFEGADGSGIPSSASSLGGGWTNTANNVGGLFGNGSLGTDIASGVQGVTDKATNSLSSLFGAGKAATEFSPGDASFLNKAGVASGGFSPGESSFLSSAQAGLTNPVSAGGGLSAALSGGTGGGSSIFSGGGLAAALGGANSLYANDKARKDLIASQNASIGQLQPYLTSGKASNTRLSELLGTGGNSSASGYGSLTKPFDPSDLTNDPGYQFELKQGQQALDRKSSASGNYFSGGALKAAQQFGTGLADQTYKDAYARDLAGKQNTYGMFSGQAGQGQSAAGAAGNIYDNIGNAKANAGISSSNIFNQSLSGLLSGSGARRPINVNGQLYYI